MRRVPNITGLTRLPLATCCSELESRSAAGNAPKENSIGSSIAAERSKRRIPIVGLMQTMVTR
jgi:hypothetical protein